MTTAITILLAVGFAALILLNAAAWIEDINEPPSGGTHHNPKEWL